MALAQGNGTPAPRRATSAAALREQYGGARLLLSDARVALLLGNEARRRALQRLVGISPEQANLVTVVGALALADAAVELTRRLRAPGPMPTPGDGVLGLALVRDLLGRVAGRSTGELPLLGTLITIAFVGHAARNLTGRAGHALRSGSREADVRFRNRYGYLIDPGHLRQRRWDRRAAPSGRHHSPISGERPRSRVPNS